LRKNGNWHCSAYAGLSLKVISQYSLNMSNNLRVLIAAEHASAQFGGEAALPLHYFRVLRKRGIEAWLCVHERTRDELKEVFAEDFDRIYFVPDTIWHRWVWQLCKPLPARLSYFTTGFILRLITQFIQRHLIQQLLQEHQIAIIHQPIPVSPKEPSMLFGMSVPVVIGPMNGGMNYPPAFRSMQSRFVDLSVRGGRWFSNLVNLLIPGKREAAALLVANLRTKEALPLGACSRVLELVENGVDLSVWTATPQGQDVVNANSPVTEPAPLLPENCQDMQITRFVYVGRLVDWKAIDLLLIAFKQVVEQQSIRLEIIGDGPEQPALKKLAVELGLTPPLGESGSHAIATQPSAGSVDFLGWQSQAECAFRLHQADVLVLPSLLECGGAVVLEAMAMGLPVIAANWGGPADYLDESCGILIEPTSREAFIAGLANAMNTLATSAEQRQRMGRAGQQRVVEHFDWEVKVDAILDVYEQAIAATASKSYQAAMVPILNKP
jgi:glycosyltransferase involved in cell wall biosynthesis